MVGQGITLALVGGLCAVLGVLFSFYYYKKSLRDDGVVSGMLSSDIGYIKAGIDDLKNRQDKQDARYLELLARLSKVEAKLEANNQK